jgi:hypothetical protein
LNRSQTIGSLEWKKMGIWSPALYGGDLAEDLKETIKAIARLPLEPDYLIELLRQNNAEIAEDPSDEEFTTFWLVLADQFHKYGLNAPTLFQRALEIIDSKQDLQVHSNLRMSPADLKKRQKVLDGLRAKLISPLPKRKAKSLAEPEPFLMDVGDLLVFPVCRQGCSLNPYMSSAMQSDWQQAAWGAVVIIERGKAFDYLAWYRPIKLIEHFPIEQPREGSSSKQSPIPDLQTLTTNPNWNIEHAGTCSPSHFRKIRVQLVGHVELNEERVKQACADLHSGVQMAINDISISNSLLPTWAGSRNTSLASFLA